MGGHPSGARPPPAGMKGNAMTRVYITSGNSFLGKHLANELLGQGYDLRLSDPEAQTVPISDRLRAALEGVDVVIHLAPEGAEEVPTHLLCDIMTEYGIGRLVLASTLEVYGEGLYADAAGRLVVPRRESGALEAGCWPVQDAEGRPLTPMRTPETTSPDPISAAGQAALYREETAWSWAEAQERQICILRLGALFGPPLGSDGTGDGEVTRMVAMIEAGIAPALIEDGGRIRDWLHVRDAARALRLAVANCGRGKPAINITSGKGHSDADVVRLIASATFRYDLEPKALHQAQAGAARHLVGMPGMAETHLGFSPGLPIENSLGELVMWVRERAGPNIPLLQPGDPAEGKDPVATARVNMD